MNDPFADQLAILRRRFVARCQTHLDALRVFQSAPSGDSGETIDIAHSLAGAGGTFGFPEISEKASRLETALLERDPGADAALRDLISELESLSPEG